MTRDEIMDNANLNINGECNEEGKICPDCEDVSGYICDSRKFKRLLHSITQFAIHEKEMPKTAIIDEREERIQLIMNEIIIDGLKTKIREICIVLSGQTDTENMIQLVKDISALTEKLRNY
jgi:hypothetical protein